MNFKGWDAMTIDAQKGRIEELEEINQQMLEALEMVAKHDSGKWMNRPWSRAVAKAIAKAKEQE